MQTKLFRRDFTLVVIGQIISLFGNSILRFALPLYLLRETGSSTLFGVVTACSFAPMVILSMVGGVLADRVNKRNIMVGLDFSTAAIIMLFYFSLGKIPTVPLFIVTLMLLYGISGTYQPAVQASVPLLGNVDIMCVKSVSYTHLDVYKRQDIPVAHGCRRDLHHQAQPCSRFFNQFRYTPDKHEPPSASRSPLPPERVRFRLKADPMKKVRLLSLIHIWTWNKSAWIRFPEGRGLRL